MQGFANIASAASGPRVREQLQLATERLAAVGVDSPRLDAEVLLADCLAMSRAQLLVGGDLPVDGQIARRFDALLARRARREPVAYILGKQEFWSLDFAVTADVLIPRPDTERLVEVALLYLAKLPAAMPLKVADLCTGSGAVAISLATELASAQLYATDISPAALRIAQGNAEAHHVAARLQFFAGDLFDALAQRPELRFDLIVSNPPYVRGDEIVTLAPEVSRWEPRLALAGGADGLDFYRRIVAAAPDYLTADGALAVEIGAAMAADVLAICADTGRYGEIEVIQDYAGKDRVVLAQPRNN